jgi:eukaryotic-like serine/threonine-protein kinase
LPRAFAGTARFQLVRQLGEGGSGVVYEAFDCQRCDRVALKVLRQAEGAALYRFKQEFRSLAEIAHPNLVSLGELLTEGSQWFFTMELVDGAPITHHATDEGGRLRALLLQLGDALNTIHRFGIVHRDIKPTNVLVTPEGRVVLLDFGIVSRRDIHEPHDEEGDDSDQDLVILGTPSYMAPEQAGNGRITPAADWYSVGVMLYEMLTGVRPFCGSNVEVIEAKQAGRPRPPTEIAPQAPVDLAEMCMKLLDPDPARRPSGMAALECIGSGMRAPLGAVLTTSRPALVGRDVHLHRLDEAFETVMSGQTVIVFVSGSSGMGKTALVQQFVQTQRMKEPTLLALTSRCYEREFMPYKALDPLVDAVAQYLQRLRDIEVARLLPRDTAVLARLFPVLLSVDEVGRAPSFAMGGLDSLTLRHRAANALHDLLFALGIRMPLMVWIDDAQWGDADSASILRQALLPPKPPLLLVVAYRSEDASEAPFLRDLHKLLTEDSEPNGFELAVEPLTYADAQQLALQLTASSGGAADRAQTIAVESRGNPFFVHELAQHASVSGPTRLDAVVLARIGALPSAARRLITAVALSAQPIPTAVAHAAAEVEAGDWGSLQLLRASLLVRTPGQGDEPTLEPYHDRIREAIISNLSASELQEWHERMAEAWKESGRARPETLLAHYLGANDQAGTKEYALLAAARAETALAFDRVAHFYGILLALEATPESQREWLMKLGDALANTGRGYEAAMAYLRALQRNPDADSIELERRAAAELIRAGYPDEAAEILNRLLPNVGVTPPRSELHALLRLFTYKLLLAVRGTGFRETSEADVEPGLLRRIDVLSSIAPPLALVSLARGNALNLQATWHALRAGERRRAVAGLAGLAASSAIGGTRTARRSQRLVREAQALARPMNDSWVLGRTELAEGICLKVSGRWKEGVQRLESAISMFSTCTGVRWEVETAQTLIHDALNWMGEWSRLARELPARRQEAEQRGDLYSATHVAARLSPLMHMVADRIQQARAEADSGMAQWTKRDFHLQHRWAVCTGIDLDLYSGNAAAAVERLSAAWPSLRGILLLFQNGRIEMLFYRARIALALAAAGNSQALKRAVADARRLEKECAEWASALAQLIRASVAWAQGDTVSAVGRLERAEAALRRCDMNLYAAAACYRRGQIAGGDIGKQLMRDGVDWMQAQQVVHHQRVADLLTPGPWPNGGAPHG